MGRPPAYIFVVRHGNRLDAADKQWHLSSPTPYDPPLTYGGWIHSRALGARIGDILRERLLEDGLPAPGIPTPRRSRQFKVVIHSSPFLRCVQTSTAISAGLASSQAALRSPSKDGKTADTAKNITYSAGSSPAGPAQGATASPRIYRTILRLDAFLGEWLSPGYFELITPPPGSVMMIASAKAELLRKENYNTYPHFQAHVALSNSPSQLWGAGSRGASALPEADARPDGSTSLDMKAMSGSLPSPANFGGNSGDPSPSISRRTSNTVSPSSGGYAAPVPTFSVSSNAPIPAGYVAHARDSCLEIDYQWDSMRAPYEWGDGGEFGEEWTSMHRRFRKGLQRLVDWYSTTDDPTDMVTKTVSFGSNGADGSADCAIDDSEDPDAESVVILVTHGAGCNALIGAITHQPVLMDVGTSSLTMAARRAGKDTLPDAAQTSAAATSTSHLSAPGIISIHDYYELKVFANTEHVRSMAPTPGASRNPSMVNILAGGARGRFPNALSTTLGPFSYTDGGGSRSSSANAALGSMRRPSGVPRAATGITVGSGVTSFSNVQGLARNQSFGLWSPLIKQDEDPFDNEDDMEMLLNFSHEKEPAAAKKPAIVIDTDELVLGANEEPPAVASASVLEGPDQVGEVPQLGFGAGGLWGSPPRTASDLERLRGDLGSGKRRWTVNERA